MVLPRVIPCLLLLGSGLFKTIRFRKPTYVGDPINAIKILNDKEVDELVLLDIGASRRGTGPAFGTIQDIASECFMPLAYGGGISTLDQMKAIFSSGVEKVIVNTLALRNPDAIDAAAREFGSQSICVSIDARRRMLGGHEVVGDGGTRRTGLEPAQLARQLASRGAGEILLNSVDQDGTMEGFDLELVRSVSDAVGVPVIACGGAGSLGDLRAAITEGHASAVSAGSMFVFHGRHRAVLISYPSPSDLRQIMRSN